MFEFIVLKNSAKYTLQYYYRRKMNRWACFILIFSVITTVFSSCISACSYNEEYTVDGTEVTCPLYPNNEVGSQSCSCCCKDGFQRDFYTGQCTKTCLCFGGKIFRESNSCVDSCESEICPFYVVQGCFCPSYYCWDGAKCQLKAF
ncbi:uncharacterized protein LOC115886516 isoform X2 [Sitophilus oryzae]|uniref:Uncharacterized protein LOC115886516 isoform X2 n=1 Tax=Sitophilus oryzae TaxID=7048 RepID=A0A6J2YDX6_SITOR|nr:uncharacterized protein LOC115886516 isoform X2 [Sitophilus oryzae]